jgi:uncharacterized membrane protein YfcA
MSIETLVIVFVAISIGAFAKGMVGIGLPMISIPILAGFIGVEHAVVVMTIPVWISNLVIVWSYRRLANLVPGLGLSLVCAASGAILGAYGLVVLDDRVLLWIMTIWLAVYLIYRAARPDFRLEGRASRIASPILAASAGVAQGATGMSGPFIATWIHSYRLQAETYVFGVSALFLAVSTGHLAGVSGFGLFDQERLILGCLALIPVVVFVRLGMRATRLISPKLFDRLILGLIVVMELKLVWQVIEGA